VYFIEIALFIAGLVLLVFGYRRNNRNLLLTAAIVLFFSAALDPMASGFWHGYSQALSAR
jgi:hypothetical protein